MKKFLCSLLILSFWALYGMAQYGPGEGGYGGVSLRFQGRLLTQGTCYQPAENILRCQIPEGSPGVLELVAERTPVGPVNVRLVSAPAGWPSFPVTSGWGTVRAQYRFTIPPGTAGSQFELLFEAWTAGIPYPLQLQVILEVVSVQPPTEPEYPPPGYVTDSQGGFSVPVGEFPDTVVSGTLTRCGIQPLPGVPVSVELIPKEGRQWIRNLGDIGAARVSSPGYGEAVVSEFRLLSSMDITGRVQRTIDVGTVCLTPPETTLPFPIPIPSPFVQGPTTEGPAVEIGGEEGGPQARPTLSILTYNTALLPTLMPKVAERAKIIPKIIAAGSRLFLPTQVALSDALALLFSSSHKSFSCKALTEKALNDCHHSLSLLFFSPSMLKSPKRITGEASFPIQFFMNRFNSSSCCCRIFRAFPAAKWALKIWT